MHVTAILLAGLAASIRAAPVETSTPRAVLASGQPLEVTNISITDINTGNTSISFNIYDPDPLTNTTALCSGTWKHGTTGYPQGTYAICGASTFAWNMDKYQSIQSFTFGLEHRFTDPSVGDPPYDQITNFARALVNTTVLQCRNTTDRVTCNQIKPQIIYASIYATIA